MNQERFEHARIPHSVSPWTNFSFRYYTPWSVRERERESVRERKRERESEKEEERERKRVM
jgi:hypothetical protein